MRTLFLSLLLCSCSTQGVKRVVVSIEQQKASLFADNRVIKTFPVSTGRGGVGTQPGSKQTPLGNFKIVQEIGEGLPINTPFRANMPVKCSHGKDGIIGRVLVIDGLDEANKNTKRRLVKVHGTPHVDDIGKPVSMGCVRFKPQDIAILCNYVSAGDMIEIKN